MDWSSLAGMSPLKMKSAPTGSVAGIAPLQMKLGMTPKPIEAGAVAPKPASSAPGATIFGLPAKEVGISAVLAGGAVAAWKFLLK